MEQTVAMELEKWKHFCRGTSAESDIMQMWITFIFITVLKNARDISQKHC